MDSLGKRLWYLSENKTFFQNFSISCPDLATLIKYLNGINFAFLEYHGHDNKEHKMVLKKLVFSMLVLLFCLNGAIFPADLDSTAYLTLSEGKVLIFDKSGSSHQGMINFPLNAGDKIITDANSHCELQFANGTVLRLGNNTQLKMITISAKQLTSTQKITTLQLEMGDCYAISQDYFRENFQIITPNASIKVEKRSPVFISVTEQEETLIKVEKGKSRVIFGPSLAKLQKETIKTGKQFIVTADHQFLEKKYPQIEFIALNQYINKNHKEIHYGKSKIPNEVLRYSPAIRHFALKWSSAYGEWLYDDLFGYVWRPYDERYALDKRPVFHADFITKNGKLLVVPQEDWGMVPANLGSWVWMNNRGWTWIPSKPDYSQENMVSYFAGFFSDFFGSFFFSRLSDWFGGECYANYFINSYWPGLIYYAWNHYEEYGYSENSDHPRVELTVLKNKARKKAVLKDDRTAKFIKQYLGKLEKTPQAALIAKFGKPELITSIISRTDKPKITLIQPAKENQNIPIKNINYFESFRDHSQDKSFFRHRNTEIYYSSYNNELVAPKLQLRSSTITESTRIQLKQDSSISVDSSNNSGNGTSSTGSGTGSTGETRMGSESQGTRKG
jgi:hypothetical protein